MNQDIGNPMFVDLKWAYDLGWLDFFNGRGLQSPFKSESLKNNDESYQFGYNQAKQYDQFLSDLELEKGDR